MGENLRSGQRWTKDELARIRSLCSSNTLFMKEIAEKLGRPATTVRLKAKELGVWSNPPGRFAEWNRKHVHLRVPAMTYFLTHSFEETAAHFNLTLSEFKSLMAWGYKDPKLKYLRKETRRHDQWTAKELVFLMRHAGVQPREWIAKKLKRGTDEAVKEALSRAGVGARYINGMPRAWAEQIFGDDVCMTAISMKAGPQGLSGRTGQTTSTYQLIPWIQADELLKKGRTRLLKGKGRWKPGRRHPMLEVPEEVRIGIRAMAKFQRWIHGVQSGRGVRKRMRAALNRR